MLTFAGLATSSAGWHDLDALQLHSKDGCKASLGVCDCIGCQIATAPFLAKALDNLGELVAAYRLVYFLLLPEEHVAHDRCYNLLSFLYACGKYGLKTKQDYLGLNKGNLC